jgi:NAD(P)-dependent dehydrogenase (short-subunit alcohol dehydrogenase family)
MDGQLALVTGGAAGLGKIIAARLHQRGSHVIIADNDVVVGSRSAAELDSGPGASFVACDLFDRDQVVALVDSIDERTGRLRLLVNNAGGWLPGPQFPDGDSWERSLQLNLAVPMLLTQLALPQLRAGGAVINIASSGGWDSAAYASPEYGAAKAGLVRFTTATADFQARYGVRVACIVPHWIGLPRAIEEYRRMSASDQRRSGGLIDPDVIAATVAGLADDADAAGKIIIVRADRAPYAVDPADYDPNRVPEADR